MKSNNKKITDIGLCDTQKLIGFLTFILISLINFSACKKFVSIDTPKTRIVTPTVFASDLTAISTVRGIYSEMLNSNGFASGGSNSLSVLGGLSSDELLNYQITNGDFSNFYSNSLTSSNSIIKSYVWEMAYKYIYYSNSILEGLKNSTAISDSIRKQLTGEAKFVRAFCYFYLVNLFGDVPLITSIDYKENSNVYKVPIDGLYDQIILDLIDANNLLLNDYSFSMGERVEPNRWVATALLSRVYLYKEDWANAEIQASSVISNPLFSLASNLNSVYLKNSNEAIWQLKPVNPGINTKEGNLFILTSYPQFVSLSNRLLNSFDSTDNRKKNWIKSFSNSAGTFYFPFKYQIKSGSNLSEYSMILRLAEQYLIRAEARAQLNNLSGAIDDLNIIRNRSNVSNYSGLFEKTSIINAILRERQLELFTEWGHRWLDLKRTGSSDTLMSIVTIEKGGTWNSYKKLYPFPQSEIDANPSLSQNFGY